eukprot:sb/3466172/
MIPLFLVFLELLATASSTPDGRLLPISSATANVFHPDHPPELAIDGDQNTYYHSTGTLPKPPQWLKLQLEEPAIVSRVVIVNRLANNVVVAQRLLGTYVYLYDADGTTQIADCGKITEVNTDNGADLTSQTYTLPCDSLQLASYVRLEDSEMEQSQEAQENYLVMNIAEVPKAFIRMPFAKRHRGLEISRDIQTKCSTLSCPCTTKTQGFVLYCLSDIYIYNPKCLSRLHVRNERLAGKHSIMKHNALILGLPHPEGHQTSSPAGMGPSSEIQLKDRIWGNHSRLSRSVAIESRVRFWSSARRLVHQAMIVREVCFFPKHCTSPPRPGVPDNEGVWGRAPKFSNSRLLVAVT